MATALSTGSAGDLEPSSARNLSTAAFLRDIGKAGRMNKEVQGFAERWIYGRGVPRITAAFAWNK